VTNFYRILVRNRRKELSTQSRRPTDLAWGTPESVCLLFPGLVIFDIPKTSAATTDLAYLGVYKPKLYIYVYIVLAIWPAALFSCYVLPAQRQKKNFHFVIREQQK